MNFLIENLDVILTTIVAIAAALGVSKIWLNNIKKELVEAIEKGKLVAEKVKEVKDATSDGGKKITTEEIKELVPVIAEGLSELYDVFNVIAEKFKKK